jgi:hypothetical protein
MMMTLILDFVEIFILLSQRAFSPATNSRAVIELFGAGTLSEGYQHPMLAFMFKTDFHTLHAALYSSVYP